MRRDRNKKISIKKPNGSAQDSYGEREEVFEDISTNIWASVSPLIGKEYFAAEQVQSQVTMKVETQYIKGISPEMIVFYEDRKLSIVSVIDPKEQHRELVLMCKELL